MPHMWPSGVKMTMKMALLCWNPAKSFVESCSCTTISWETVDHNGKSMSETKTIMYSSKRHVQGCSKPSLTYTKCDCNDKIRGVVLSHGGPV